MFTLTIDVRTGHFGETATSERHGVARLLQQAIQEIMSGGAPSPLKDSGGHIVGHYEFGAAAINGPGEGFDTQHRNIRPVLQGGRVG